MLPPRPLHPCARARSSRFLVVAWLCLGALAASPHRAGAATGLAAAAQASGRYFGVAIQGSKLADATYVTIANREFDMVTPENEMKLDVTEPQRGVFNFTPGDRIVAWAEENGKRVHGYNLLWHSGLPSWLASLTGSALRSAMLDHVQRVATHYQGRVAYWDVVSEAFVENGTRRSSMFQRTGDDWIEAAFRAARAADPAAKLCLDDYGLESWSSAKTQAVYALVQDFKARGVPIDCVSIEGHFTGGVAVPSTLATTLARFASLGVEVALTQVDVTNADPAQYAALTTACMSVAQCVGITVWGVRDTDSWRSSDRPLLFDGSGNPKPAYQAVLDALRPNPVSYGLTVTKAGTGSGTVTSSAGGILCGTGCFTRFPSGAAVTLTATSDGGSTFVGWGGACTGSGACIVTMTMDQAVTATFDTAGTSYALTVTRSGTGSGTVTSSAGGILCGTVCSASIGSGTAVTLTATADAGSTFAGWSGACTGTGDCVVTMTAARGVGAAFTARPSTPCPNPITFARNTEAFNTTGAVCYRSAMTVWGWGCSSFSGRTVSVNGGRARTCGAGPFPLPRAADGYTYFSVSAGSFTWASLYTW